MCYLNDCLLPSDALERVICIAIQICSSKYRHYRVCAIPPPQHNRVTLESPMDKMKPVIQPYVLKLRPEQHELL